MSPEAAPQVSVDDAMRRNLGIQVPPVAPVAPTQPPAAPQAQPEVFAISKEEVEQMRANETQLTSKVEELSQGLGAALGELDNLKSIKQREEQHPLPSDNELDDLPRSRAMKLVAEHAAAVAAQDLEARMVPGLRNMAADMVTMKKASDESTVREAYPDLNLDKYRAEWDRVRGQNPGLSALQAIRACVPTADLMPAPPVSTTPATQDGGVHMEAGPGASAGRSIPQPPAPTATREELISASAAYRAKGMTKEADACLAQVVRATPSVPATPRGMPTR